jgi:hypothetical protein
MYNNKENQMIHEIKPDSKNLENLDFSENSISIFLAGSIDMGSSKKWASELVNRITEINPFEFDIVFYNPRRDAWDNTWEQEESNPVFNYQVNWELDNIEDSDIIFFNILPESKSPITLMELGLCAGSNAKVIVCCPDGFYRKGNVDILCTRYEMPQYPDFDSAFGALLTTIGREARRKY